MYKGYCEITPKTIKRAYNILESCELCPRVCGVNRLNDEKGICGIGSRAIVSSVTPHFGEESVLVGNGGSGTIFFAGCNLGCVFCQNYDIRHLIMPNNIAGSKDIVDFIVNDISENTFINIMDQYRPTFKAHNYPETNRHITHEEFHNVYVYAKKRGLRLSA